MKFLFFASLLIPSISMAQVDYSSIPQKSYNKYQYQPSTVDNRAQPSQSTQSVSQTSSQSYVYQGQELKGVQKKYQNLFNNRATKEGCWQKAAQAYNLDPWLLISYAKVESSFRSHAINQNKDKKRSIDIGMMQINSFWFPILAKYGISRQHLMDPCLSLFVSSWIISQNIKRFGYNIDGIGAYNSPNNIKLRRSYGRKVYSAYSEITRDLYYNKKK